MSSDDKCASRPGPDAQAAEAPFPPRDPGGAECTRDPVFLFQRRHVVICCLPDGFGYDGDVWWVENFNAVGEAFQECVFGTADDGYEVDDDKLIAAMLSYTGDAVAYAREEFWTELVFWSREEAEQYGEAKQYRYHDGWRVFCVPAGGRLARLLNATEAANGEAAGPCENL